MVTGKSNYALQRFTLLILVLLFLAACERRTTPPGPDAISGAVHNTSYTLLSWDEGLRILIWANIDGAWGSAGSGSTEDEVYRQEGHGDGPDGRAFEYYLETTDGVTADFSIDGQPYDLEEGSVFLIASSAGQTEVTQLDSDLSAVTATNEGVEALGRDTPEIANLMEQSGGR